MKIATCFNWSVKHAKLWMFLLCGSSFMANKWEITAPGCPLRGIEPISAFAAGRSTAGRLPEVLPWERQTCSLFASIKLRAHHIITYCPPGNFKTNSISARNIRLWVWRNTPIFNQLAQEANCLQIELHIPRLPQVKRLRSEHIITSQRARLYSASSHPVLLQDN